MGFVTFMVIGEISLLYDTVHDEVFIDGSGLVLMINGRWCFSESELKDIFSFLYMGVLV